MKTLIFNGSPRKNGDTVSLLNIFQKHLTGDIKTVEAYYCNIKPCTDCRFCFKHTGCCQNDEMQDIYSYIKECDNILIASPIYFSEITGQLLNVFSRLQTFYCARAFRNEVIVKKQKKGGIILLGGGDGQLNKAYETAKTLLHHMNAYDIAPLVSSHNTNVLPSSKDTKAINNTIKLAHYFNSK